MGRMRDGFKTLIGFSANGAVKMEEIEVTPPPLIGGGGINTTTMRNTAIETQAPHTLYKIGDSGATVSWDPKFYNDVKAMINVIQVITITFPDGTVTSYYGWIDEFTPGSQKSGEEPTAEIKIIASGTNTTFVEANITTA